MRDPQRITVVVGNSGEVNGTGGGVLSEHAQSQHIATVMATRFMAIVTSYFSTGLMG